MGKSYMKMCLASFKAPSKIDSDVDKYALNIWQTIIFHTWMLSFPDEEPAAKWLFNNLHLHRAPEPGTHIFTYVMADMDYQISIVMIGLWKTLKLSLTFLYNRSLHHATQSDIDLKQMFHKIMFYDRGTAKCDANWSYLSGLTVM